MRHSIRARFTVTFIALITLILLAIWAVNTWLLGDYYVSDKMDTLEAGYRAIDRMLQEEPLSEMEPYSEGSDADELSRLLRDLGEKYNTTIVLVDSVTGKAVVSTARDKNYLTNKVRNYVFGQYREKPQLMREHENYIIQRTYNPVERTADLEAWGFFSDNTTLFIMSTPLSSIWESVDISNQFLALVGSAALVLGCVVVYLISREITHPIMELARQSQEMTNLNFDLKYTGKQKDEIGILGANMNALSDKLQETITELQEANEQLQKDINEKIQIDEMRKEFIANVSHELKTPIALIQGYAEGLTEGMCEDEESRNYYCGVIMDEAVKMNRMVRQLLNLTALEFGNDTPVMETFDLIAVIQGILSSSSILIQQKEAAIIFERKAPLFVCADEFKIEEVITNYLNNALNHLDGRREIRITVQEEDGRAKILVYNTGTPIPEEDLSKLWTKFYKVDKARTRAYGGSGIGLSIVKAIMDSHHQECGVRNADEGVEFWFTVALAHPPQEEETPSV